MKDRREEKKRREGENIKIKEKLKLHPNIPSQLIADYSYIFAPFLDYVEIQLHFCPFFFELEM